MSKKKSKEKKLKKKCCNKPPRKRCKRCPRHAHEDMTLLLNIE